MAIDTKRASVASPGCRYDRYACTHPTAQVCLSQPNQPSPAADEVTGGTTTPRLPWTTVRTTYDPLAPAEHDARRHGSQVEPQPVRTGWPHYSRDRRCFLRPSCASRKPDSSLTSWSVFHALPAVVFMRWGLDHLKSCGLTIPPCEGRLSFHVYLVRSEGHGDGFTPVVLEQLCFQRSLVKLTHSPRS